MVQKKTPLDGLANALLLRLPQERLGNYVTEIILVPTETKTLARFMNFLLLYLNLIQFIFEKYFLKKHFKLFPFNL